MPAARLVRSGRPHVSRAPAHAIDREAELERLANVAEVIDQHVLRREGRIFEGGPAGGGGGACFPRARRLLRSSSCRARFPHTAMTAFEMPSRSGKRISRAGLPNRAESRLISTSMSSSAKKAGRMSRPI